MTDRRNHRAGHRPPPHTSGLDELQRAHAVQTVAGHAIDARDCLELLVMLGLDTHSTRAE